MKPRIADILLWFVLLGALATVYVSIASDTIPRDQFYNADAAYLPLFYRDLVLHEPILGWRHPPAPYFFPDMLLYILLNAVTQNVHLSIMGYGVLQSLLWIGGLIWLSRLVFGADFGLPRLALVGGTLFFQLLDSGACPAFLPIVQNGYHFGTMLSLMGTSILMVLIVRSGRFRITVLFATLLLFGLATVALLSDTIYLPQVLLPALAAGLLLLECQMITPRRLLPAYGALVLAVPANAYLSRWVLIFRNDPTTSESASLADYLTTIRQTFQDLLRWPEEYWTDHRFLAIFVALWLLFIVLAVIVAGRTIAQSWRIRLQRGSGWQTVASLGLFSIPCLLILAILAIERQEWLIGLALLPAVIWSFLPFRKPLHQETEPVPLALLLMAFLVFSVGSNLMTTLMVGGSSARYFQPALLLPLFFGWPFLLGNFPKVARFLKTPLFLVGALALIAANGWWTGGWASLRHITALRSLIDYYPAFVQCLDDHAQADHLRSGLAQYWHAKYVTLLSKQGLQVVQARYGGRTLLSPDHLINNFNWYDRNFEFVIADEDQSRLYRIDPTAVQEKFGEPAQSFICDDKTILVYNRPQDAAFQQQFAAYFALPYQALDLPSQTGQVLGTSRRAAEPDVPGFLTYGPYVELPIGDYGFVIHYQAQATPPEPSGKWDVIMHQGDAAEPLMMKKGSFPPAEASEIRGEFKIRQSGIIELRTYYTGHGMLRIDKIQIDRIR